MVSCPNASSQLPHGVGGRGVNPVGGGRGRVAGAEWVGGGGGTGHSIPPLLHIAYTAPAVVLGTSAGALMRTVTLLQVHSQLIYM